MKLTKSQQLAVQSEGKNILVSAGAGTGKTRVLVERFIHFVTAGKALATEILALTFTEKAANEMKSRILERLSELQMETSKRDLESAYISTIHAFAARLLREHPLEAGLDPDFRVIEGDEAAYLREQALDKAFENVCLAGDAVFELVRVYGENRIREGILKVFYLARHEGQMLEHFFNFAEKLRNQDTFQIEGDFDFEALEDEEVAQEWRCFSEETSWDWDKVEEFKEWSKNFSRKRDKKEQTTWKDFRALNKKLLAYKFNQMVEVWYGPFEQLSLNFEVVYETKKKEMGLLDFDDLQIYALKLFTREHAANRNILNHYRRKFKQIMVDEFQDTNSLQLQLIDLLSGDDHLFLVGDYKQSIYAFRGAEPNLFLARERDYREKDSAVWLPLLENFRTEETTLKHINLFFESLWQEGDFTYEPLIARQNDQGAPRLQAIYVDAEAGGGMDQLRMQEADQIAAHILDLNKKGTSFGDIAILFQAMTDVGIYEQALKKRGIPYYALSSRGFYFQPEIRDIISFLSFLDNPLADIPLAASLRSPLFQVSDNALVWLSKKAKDEDSYNQMPTPFFEAIQNVDQIEEIEDVDRKNILIFKSLTEELLFIKDRLKLTELIDFILEKTSYELTVLADPQGVRRYANLKKLVNLARKFESHEPLSLHSFLKTLRRLETQEVRESEAQIEAEQSGRVVSLLSVHRAKGLEFPVVFMADMSRGKQAVEAKTVIGEIGQGYSLQVRNEKTLEWEKPLCWHEMNERLNQKDKEEWKRLFYVGMTRTKRDLIFSGAVKEGKALKETYDEMSSWMDWIRSSPLVTQITPCLSAEPGVQKRKLALAEKEEFQNVFKKAPAAISSLSSTNRQEMEKILTRIQFSKGQPARVIDLPVSAYVSYDKSKKEYWAIYEIGCKENPEEFKKSVFSDSAETDWADFGTRMHLVLEKLNFAQFTNKEIKKRIGACFSGLSDKLIQEAEQILTGFIKSALFQRIQNAKTICKELPFVLNGRHGMIHGIIDLIFEDAEGWHIVDYKTAIGDEVKVSQSGYVAQLELYAHAISEILGQIPRSGSLYFLKNNWSYCVDWQEKDLKNLRESVQARQLEILEFTQEKRQLL